MKQIILASALALGLLSTNSQAAEGKTIDPAREAQLKAEMQQLSQRMGEIGRELSAGGAGAAMAFSITDPNGNSTGRVKIKSISSLANVEGMDLAGLDLEGLAKLSGMSGFALGTLLKDRDGKVFVEAVTPGSGAEKAGIKANDQIVSVRGKAIAGNAKVADVRAQIGELKAQEVVPLTVLRDGQSIQAQVTASAQPRISMVRLDGKDPNVSAKITSALQNLPTGQNGSIRVRAVNRIDGTQVNLDMVSVSADLAPYFGTSTGVLVVDAKGYAPLLGGDVITAIDGVTISSPSDFADQFAKKMGQEVRVNIFRQKQASSLTMRLLPKLETE